MTPNFKDRPIGNNLMALGSAAVIAVYGAGFVRTRAAAARFDGEDAQRRAAARSSTAGNAGSAADSTRTMSSPVGALVTEAAGAKPGPATLSHAAAAQGTVKSTAAPQPAAQRMVAPNTPLSAAPSAATPATPVEPTAPAAPTPQAAPTTPAPAPASPDTAADQKDKVHAQYADGIYTGWGTSRHGDIESSVEIRNGRIVSASIAQCLTRYSCSWISMLPGQVVTRQSAEVDYVSGATQSSNAFYYGVLEALKKAK